MCVKNICHRLFLQYYYNKQLFYCMMYILVLLLYTTLLFSIQLLNCFLVKTFTLSYKNLQSEL